MKKFLALLLTAMLCLSVVGGFSALAEGDRTISILIDTDMSLAGFNAVAALAEEKLGIHVDIEYRVGGAEGDNIVKTRLASGTMTDIVGYNSGALLAALNPTEYFYDLSNEPLAERLDETYASSVTVNGELFGVPISSTQAGAVVYNRAVYEEYGLEVPKTWDEFIANCRTIKDAGGIAMIGGFGDSWTSQVLFLGDHYNVVAQEPNFTKDFEAGIAKYATTPAATRSFEKFEDLVEFYDPAYLADTYDNAVDKIAYGDGAHWIILTQALTNIYSLEGKEVVDNLGVFGIPADEGETGLTVWMPTSMYVNKNSENLDAVLELMDFYTTEEALDAYVSALLPDGPFCIKGYEMPDDAYRAVAEDMQAYFDAGLTHVAMEFETPVKGANCMQICVEVGSGQVTGAEAAAMYDEDCKLQAMQLGLEGWE